MLYEDNPFFTFDLTCLNRIAFGVADDPFYKPLRAKFYPEVVVIDKAGQVLATSSPFETESALGMQYDEGFRDTKLKLNDDKKVKITLSAIKEKQVMILLLVKTYDLRKEPAKAGEFDRAQFRLFNEDTNQTLDYSQITKIEKPEGFEEEEAPPEPEEGEEGDAQAKPRNELLYLAGRLFQDENDRWIYESYNSCFMTDKHPNIVESLSEINRKAQDEDAYYKAQLKKAEDTIKTNEEERRAAAKAAANKKKKGKKEAKEAEEEVE